MLVSIIYKLAVQTLWKTMFGKKTTAPENTMLNDFNNQWDQIDKQQRFKTLGLF